MYRSVEFGAGSLVARRVQVILAAPCRTERNAKRNHHRSPVIGDGIAAYRAGSGSGSFDADRKQRAGPCRASDIDRLVRESLPEPSHNTLLRVFDTADGKHPARSP